MDRLKIAQYIALGATACSVIGFIIAQFVNLGFGLMVMMIGFIIGIVSYLFGGLLTAGKMAAKIAKWGWIIVPFPFDIMTFIIAFFIAVILLTCLPIIPVHKAYKEGIYK